MPLPHASPLERAIVTIAAGFLVCMFLIFLFASPFERDAPGGFDRGVTLAVHTLHAPGRDRFARTLTLLGGHRFLIPAAVVVAAGLARSGHRPLALLFLTTAGGAALWNILLKLAFERARPDLWPALVREDSSSFPSGHAALATAFGGGVVLIVGRLTRRRALWGLASAGAAAFVLAVGATRVYLGAHWATDVAAGVVVGLLWVLTCAAGAAFLGRPSGGAPPALSERRPDQ
jgi:undecaprenyl-diphosphatase